MASIILTRRKAIVAAALTAAAVGGGFWYFQPDRQLQRNWTGFLDAISARKAVVLGRFVAPEYTDRWGYERTALLEDARLAFLQFRELEVTAENVEMVRDRDQAVVRAIIRLQTDGQPGVSDARATVNALYTPFTFEWRRDPGFPWTWKLTQMDHAGIDLRRFRDRRGY